MPEKLSSLRARLKLQGLANMHLKKSFTMFPPTQKIRE